MKVECVNLAMDELIFRSYQPGDEHAILAMFNQVFDQNRKLEHWYWKYRDHPWGRGAISLAVAPDGTLAAHFGGYPIRLLINWPRHPSQEIWTYHLGDKMSRPEFRHIGFRKKGVLARTFFHFKDTYGSSLPFALGFATGKSFRLGRLLFQYMDVEGVSFREKELPLVAGGIRSKVKAQIAGVRVQEVDRIDNSWTDFFYRVAASYGCLTLRTAEYLNWRYMQCPDRKYLMLALFCRDQLVGWSVFARDSTVVQWVDALFDPEYSQYAGLVIEYLARHPVSQGAEKIDSWFPARPFWWHKALDKLGFVQKPEPNNLHVTGPLFSDPQSEEILGKNFYYTYGDSDLV